MTLVVSTLTAASEVAAQGPRRVPPGHLRRAPAPDRPAQPPRVRTLGAWLDDASVLAEGDVWLGLSMTRWASPVARGVDLPAVDVALGVNRRLQVSASMPYYRMTDSTGLSVRGFGDMYVTAKVPLRDPASETFGLALVPGVEILSRAAVSDSGPRRLNWVLPVSLEVRRPFGRLYGAAGYFSRGAAFAGGAVERGVGSRAVITGALTHSIATDDQAMSEAAGLSRRRTDASGSLVYSVTPAVSVFGSLGRTLSKIEYDSATMVANLGVAVTFKSP